MKDIINIATGQPFEATGYVSIQYKDPITGKIKEQFRSKNHVFQDNVFSVYSGSWRNYVSSLQMLLTDSNDAIDENFPLITGKLIGYGVPLQGSSGLKRGAYNAALSYLDSQSMDGVKWKFTYDFTPSQALGSIKTIGLTTQHLVDPENCGRTHYKRFMAQATVAADSFKDYFTYSCSNIGVLTKWDTRDGSYTQIDLSAIIGANTSTTKAVGRATEYGNNKMYVMVRATLSSGTALNKMYEFSDDTFSTLLNTYSIPVIGYSTTQLSNFYIHDSDVCVYLVSRALVRLAFRANMYLSYNITDYISPTDYPFADSYCETVNTSFLSYTTSISKPYHIGKYLLLFYPYTANYRSSLVYDFEYDNIVGDFTLYNASNLGLLKIPTSPYYVQCGGLTNYASTTNGAVTRYRVPDGAPARPDGYGMTVSYELEVNW